MKRLKLSIAFLTAAIMLLSAGSLVLPQKAAALSGSEFQAGRIIDDGIFFNGNTLSIAQIQQFLNAKVPHCDTNGTQPYAGTTRAAYATSRGYPPPYTCLKDYRQTSVAKPADGLCNGYGVANQSAAEIIYNVGQNCGVSQKALLVLLEKEQSLVTDDWPWSIQYRSATGYGCPDTAPCDAEYYGFFNQVYSAARQFKRYVRDSHLFNYAVGENSFILYNPNSGCGGSHVFLQNSATAALYNYTPYQPNSAALNNLYGSGDSCSAYGNRNFWRLHNDWFGSTLAPTYAWQLTGQYAFTDQTKTTPVGLANLAPGQRVFIGFTAKNLGNLTWSNSGPNPVNVGTVRPIGRNSPFFDPSWLGPNRPARLKEATVAPGQTGTFEFWITAPQSGGGHINEHLGLVSEGAAWMPDIGLYFATSVQPATYTWQLTGQYAFTDQTKTVGESLINLEPGDRVYVGLTAKNTGNITWTNSGPNPVHLGITNPMDRYSPFFENTWLGQNRPARLKEASVAPGQVGTFEFWMNVPAKGVSGNFYEYYNLVMENRAWMRDIGLNFFGSVVKPQYTWQLTGQYAFTDQTKTTGIGLHRLSPGQRVYIGFTARNTGNVSWRNNGHFPIDVGTFNPIDRNSAFFDPTWFGPNRPARLLESAVAPGQVGTFEFFYKAPNQPGNYLEYFNLVAENYAWMPTIGLNFSTTVQ